MHIPAMDSLRHERVGKTCNDGAQLVLQTYVQTEETDELGANNPLEALSRPFPLLMSLNRSVVLEDFIEGTQITPFSQTLIEYASLLYESMQNEEWEEEISEYTEEVFPEEELPVALELKRQCTAEQVPTTLWRTVFEAANNFNRDTTVTSNPLKDISGHERYNFPYLPSLGEVDEWTLKTYQSAGEVEDEDWVDESLWLRYTIGDTTEERPIIANQRGPIGPVSCSPNVDYGNGGQNNAPYSLIVALLNTNYEADTILSAPHDELSGTKTEEYLNAYLTH